jgi:photosystem II stability/assembly factor-like uncharacterized protein
MSVAVSSVSSGNRSSKVYVGTEPSALYISNDGGNSWERMKALNKLPSARTWSFPPRPWTHHIRWIEPDANNLDYIFAAIEAGALVQSHDGGKTWIDRSDQGPYDTHTLVTHSKAPRRLYSATGDGYFESRSGFSYSTENAESFVYRKDNDDRKWRAVTNGLPEPSGTTITIFASNPNVSGEFYAVNTDSDDLWNKLDTPWSVEYPPQSPWALQ